MDGVKDKPPCSVDHFVAAARAIIGMDREIDEMISRREKLTADIESLKSVRQKAATQLTYEALPEYGERRVLVGDMVVTVSYGHHAWPKFEAVPVEVP